MPFEVQFENLISGYTAHDVTKGVSSPDSFDPDNIADIKSIAFKNITFPPNAGVVVLFKVGKKRGFFFDLAPLDDTGTARQFDILKLLGNYASYMLQTDLFE